MATNTVSPKASSPIAPPNAPAAPSAAGAPQQQEWMKSMKQAMPGQQELLGNMAKSPFGELPKPGGDAKGAPAKSPEADAKDPNIKVWQDLYNAALKRAEQAKNPAEKAHAEAEAKQIKTTLDAMQGKSPAGAEGAPGAPGAAKEGAQQGGTPQQGAPAQPGAADAPKAGAGIEQYKEALDAASQATGVPAEILGGMLWQESRGNAAAGSVNGGNGQTDTGLMQINPNTYQELQAKHPELQGKDLSEPANNIMAAAHFMADLKDKFGSWDLALRAYNSGENGVDPGNPNATPAGTGDPTYIPKVMEFAETIKAGGDLPA